MEAGNVDKITRGNNTRRANTCDPALKLLNEVNDYYFTVVLEMSNEFDTINIHTLIRKLLQTRIPGTIIKLIANYIYIYIYIYIYTKQSLVKIRTVKNINDNQ